MAPTKSTNGLLLLAGALLLAQPAFGQTGVGGFVPSGHHTEGDKGISVGRGGSVSTGVGSSEGKGSSSSKDAASGVGDPIMTGFDGHTFEFQGDVGATYSLLSEATHQLSTRLKFAHMWDHDGTYMEAFSLRYRDHHVTVELTLEDSLSVRLDGKPLAMEDGETQTEALLGLVQGELNLHWQLYKPGYGNAVAVATEALEVLVWLTPAGTFDEGGVEQPAYLNFELQLRQAPAGGRLEGAIGRTYSAAASGQARAGDLASSLAPEEYRMADFLDTSHTHCLFHPAEQASKPQQARRLLTSARHGPRLVAGFHR